MTPQQREEATALEESMRALTVQILDMVRQSPLDVRARPFAAISAAAKISIATLEGAGDKVPGLQQQIARAFAEMAITMDPGIRVMDLPPIDPGPNAPMH